MSLEISLSSPKAVYRPGEQISGTVKFNSNGKSIAAQQVYISLKHTSKCRFGLPELETLYGADLMLNEQTIELLEGPTNLQSSSEWAFKFILAETTGFYQTPFHEPSRLYNDAPDQILPPSFFVARKDTASTQEAVTIALGLYAEIASEKVKSNVFKKDGINAVHILNFQPQRKNVLVDWDMTTKQSNFEARTPLLAETNGHRDRSLSIKEKMLTSIKSSSLPTATFDVLISMPKTAVIGQPLPLFIGLQHDKVTNAAQNNPPVNLKTLVVKLETITSLRGLSESKSLFRAENLPASHSAWTRTIELAKLTTPIELKDIVDLREHLIVRIPNDTVQSFSTFNIARTYTLHVQISVECAKQKFTTSYELNQVKLLAPHDNDADNPPGVAPRSLGHDGDRLPTWEESGGYGDHGIPAEKEDEPLPPQYA